MTKSVIYIVACAEYVKVGRATNIKTRLSGLQIGNPLPCTLIHKADVDRSIAHKAEALAHAKLAKFRHTGEWFAAPVDVARDAVDAACQEAMVDIPQDGLTMQQIGVELATEVLKRKPSQILTEQHRFDYCYAYRTHFDEFDIGPMDRNEARLVINWKPGEPKPAGSLPLMTKKLWTEQVALRASREAALMVAA
jgi:hypothetical protein